jgi:hypothetical protein
VRLGGAPFGGKAGLGGIEALRGQSPLLSRHLVLVPGRVCACWLVILCICFVNKRVKIVKVR